VFLLLIGQGGRGKSFLAGLDQSHSTRERTEPEALWMPNTDEGSAFMSDPLGQFGPTARPGESEFLAESFRHRTRAANAMGFVGDSLTSISTIPPRAGVVGGTILVQGSGCVWRDVPLSSLGSPSLDDFSLRMRATQDYAGRNGFVGGFPTYFHADYGNGICVRHHLLTVRGCRVARCSP